LRKREKIETSRGHERNEDQGVLRPLMHPQQFDPRAGPVNRVFKDRGVAINVHQL
jgi:hypothetical protein